MESLSGGPANLQSVWLQEAILRFARLSTVNLEAADLSGADLTHARVDQANLNAAKLTNARSDYADFTGAKLTKANLCGASLRFTTLSTADLEAADLSGADLVHARLDQANLSAANLANASLDYADFAGADLTKANLCGASLHHVKNLTPAQIEHSIGSASTILPPHLQGSVSWSAAKGQAEEERRDRRLRARDIDDIHPPHISHRKTKAWRVGALISFALVATALMWRHMSEAVPLDPFGGQGGSQPFVIQPDLGTNTAEQESQPAANGALMEERATDERHPIADAETPPNPSGSSTIDQTKMTDEHLPSEAATISAKGAKLGDQAANTPEDNKDESSRGSILFSAKSRHAVPDVISAESPAATSAHAIVPDSSTQVSMHDSQFPPTIDVPAEAPAVNTPEPPAASFLSGTQTPNAVTIQGDVAALLPANSETPPVPIRNPTRQGFGGSYPTGH